MKNVMFTGIMPALVTPLREDGTVNAPEVEPLMKWQLSQGADGFYVLGGTGEGAVLAERERMRMAEAAIAAKGTGKIIVQVGAIDPFEAQRLARHAAQIGADAISSVCPNFYYQYTAEEICAYYDALVQACGLPLLCYCNALAGQMDVVKLAETIMRVDGVIGMKYTMPDYFNLRRIKQLNGGDINVLNGPDQTLLCGLIMGADGGIGTSYNLAPHWFTALYRSYRQGDWETARRYQYQIDDMVCVLRRYGPIYVTKLCLEAMGFRVGLAAFPGGRFREEERAKILEELKMANVF